MQPEELQIASYRGVEFLVSEAPTTGGRKTVIKRPVNSDRQGVEDLGLMPREFTLRGTLAARRSPDGSERVPYRVARQQLLDALEAGGPGVLVHPFLGRIPNVAVLSYTLRETTTRLGDSPLEITFALDDGAVVPRAAESIAGSIEAGAESVSEAAQSDIAEAFEVITQQVGVFQDAIEQVQETTEKITEAIRRVATAGEDIAELLRDTEDLGGDASEVVNEPPSLAERLLGVLDEIPGALGTADLAFRAYRRLFTVGDSIARLTQDTIPRQTRQRNRDVLFGAVKARALAGAYSAAAEREYATTDEVSEVESILEAQFQALDSGGNVSDTVLEELRALRVSTHRFLEEQRDLRPRVITVRTPVTTARLLAYRYYGSTELGDTLARLNGSLDGILAGEVRILSS